MKARTHSDVTKFTDIPNVGKAMERDFVLLGIRSPKELAKKDAYVLYKKLEKLTGTHQDPCVLDTYMAVVDFMQGAPARPWYAYTKERKKKYPR